MCRRCCEIVKLLAGRSKYLAELGLKCPFHFSPTSSDIWVAYVSCRLAFGPSPIPPSAFHGNNCLASYIQLSSKNTALHTWTTCTHFHGCVWCGHALWGARLWGLPAVVRVRCGALMSALVFMFTLTCMLILCLLIYVMPCYLYL